jgi:hypothetical protein
VLPGAGRPRIRAMRAGLLLAAAVVAALAATGGAPAARSGFASFRTPSGNIGCVYSTGPAYLRCDIRSGLEPKPSRPAGCDLDWGDSVSLARLGRTRVVCHGDTAILPGSRILRYGHTWTRGPFTCVSRTNGLTCDNAAGRGFFLSRQSWRRF